jgi:hypothetical protein
VARISPTALKLTWHKVQGADGYQVLRYDSKKKKYVSVAVIKNGAAVGWVNKKLKTGKKYTYKVRSFRALAGGLRQYSPLSYKISAVAYKLDAKKVNASGTLKGVSGITVGIGQYLKVDVTPQPSALGTSKKKTVVDKSIRLYLTPVEAEGVRLGGGRTVAGRRTGRYHVFALAHNGNVKNVSVDVVDYARPERWVDLDEVEDAPADFILYSGDLLKDVVSYLAAHGEYAGDVTTITLGSGDVLKQDGDMPLADIEEEAVQLFKSAPEDTYMEIWATKYGVTVRIYGSDRSPIVYTIQYRIKQDYSKEEIEDYESTSDNWVHIASHWYYMMSVPAE